MDKEAGFEKDFCFSVRSGGCAFSPSPAARAQTMPYTPMTVALLSATASPKESDSGLLGYTDANGVKQQINKTDVKEVSEIPH